MKWFVYTTDRMNRNGDVSGTIYRIRNNTPEFISRFEYRTCSTRGATHEVFNKLMDLGYIPKKYKKSSVCSWRGPGYFAGEVQEHYSIMKLGDGLE